MARKNGNSGSNQKHGRAAPRSEALAKELADKAKGLIGISARIDVLDPASIERVSIGKARRVFDNRPKS